MEFSTPQIVRDTDQLRRIVRGWRGTGSTVALAPILGSPHDGHLGLSETARRHAARVIVSASGTMDMAQATLLGRAECDLIFVPNPEPESATRICVNASGLGDQTALDATTTRLTRLLGQVQPDIAVFGEKDWLQLVAIRQAVRDLALPVGIVSAATVREKDGLALSTRNASLSAEDRVTAPTLNKVLTASAGLIAQGNPVDQVAAATQRFLAESGFTSVEYVTVRRAYDLAPVTEFSPAKPARLFAAAHLGSVRLSDNVPIQRVSS